MKKIYNIKYFDSFFTYEKELPKKIELKIHECFGYVKEKKSHLQISFIICKSDKRTCDIEGLIIPKKALTTQKVKINTIPLKSKVSVTWNDIVHFKNTVPKTYSTMYTEGILIKQNPNFIIIKNPETIRINPKPIKNHPQKKPTFFIIHSSIITDIQIIK